MSQDHKNSIFKTPNLLLLDIDRPLPIGTRVTYVTPDNEVVRATVVQGGYVSLVVWDGAQVHVILYGQLRSVG